MNRSGAARAAVEACLPVQLGRNVVLESAALNVISDLHMWRLSAPRDVAKHRTGKPFNRVQAGTGETVPAPVMAGGCNATIAWQFFTAWEALRLENVTAWKEEPCHILTMITGENRNGVIRDKTPESCWIKVVNNTPQTRPRQSAGRSPHGDGC